MYIPIGCDIDQCLHRKDHDSSAPRIHGNRPRHVMANCDCRPFGHQHHRRGFSDNLGMSDHHNLKALKAEKDSVAKESDDREVADGVVLDNLQTAMQQAQAIILENFGSM